MRMYLFLFINIIIVVIFFSAGLSEGRIIYYAGGLFFLVEGIVLFLYERRYVKRRGESKKKDKKT